MKSSDQSHRVILVGGDLLTRSRVQSAISARVHDTVAAVVRVRNLGELSAAIPGAQMIVIDLARCKESPDLPLESVLAEVLAGRGATPSPIVIGFGPHVDAPLLRAARAGGCTVVVPNSMLEETLASVEMTVGGAPRDLSVENEAKGEPKREHGAGALTLLVFGTIIGAFLYAAYSIAPFYYYYYELQNHFEQTIPIAGTETDMEIRRRLLYHIRRYELPVEDEQLSIVRSGNIMSISLRYTEVFLIEWDGKELLRWDFPFHAHAEGEY